MMNGDEDLRSRFDALRQLDGAAVPAVDAILARRAVRRPRRVAVTAMVAAAAIVLLAVGVRFAASRPADTISVESGEPSLLAWRSPTASLLQTPGSELLLDMPSLGSSLLRSFP